MAPNVALIDPIVLDDQCLDVLRALCDQGVTLVIVVDRHINLGGRE